MERALETQRVKLLRLLVEWFAIVGFLSLGPLRVELPRWLRAFLASLLIRAELAAQNLICVAACVAANKGMGQSAAPRVASLPYVKPNDSDDTVPSTQALIRRMKALRGLLENLSRHGLRMLRRRAGTKSKRARAVWPIGCEHSLSRDQALADPRIDRPPDKARRDERAGDCLLIAPTRLRAGAEGVCAERF